MCRIIRIRNKHIEGQSKGKAADQINNRSAERMRIALIVLSAYFPINVPIYFALFNVNK